MLRTCKARVLYIYVYSLVVFHFEDTVISRSAPLYCSLHCSYCIVLLFPAKCGIAVLVIDTGMKRQPGERGSTLRTSPCVFCPFQKRLY